jgi:hypothetical protein
MIIANVRASHQVENLLGNLEAAAFYQATKEALTAPLLEGQGCYFSAMPFSASSFLALSFLVR